MMAQPVIRTVQPTDIADITAIYSHYVLSSTATFEIEPPGEDEMWRRAAGILDLGLPYLVAESGGRIAGYAYAGTYRPRPGYAKTAESSVYVAPTTTRSGFGRALMKSVIDECRKAGKHRLIAGIGDRENTGSIALHNTLGFRHVGTFSEVGFKFGRYIDTLFFELALD